MIEQIYIEDSVREHPTTLRVCNQFPKASVVSIGRYGEVFNRSNQNFRLQKKKSALILAEKQNETVLPTPSNYTIGGSKNYYFSHMLNCLYDCRYCFLQGMFRSANYVFFVNDEDFKKGLQSVLDRESANSEEPVYFFSGYDCDSLALEKITQFTIHYFPFFRENKNAMLELRTKSSNIRPLLSVPPLPNAIIAFTMSPEPIAKEVEHKSASTLRRIQSAKKLAHAGWRIGLRLDPLIYHENWKENYSLLLDQLSKEIPEESIHSVTMGPMRFPKAMFHRIQELYPKDPLISGPLHSDGKNVSYEKSIEMEMHAYCKELLSNYYSENRLFCYEV